MEKDMEMNEILLAFFTTVTTDKACLKQSKATRIRSKVWNKEYLPFVEENQAKAHLNWMYTSLCVVPARAEQTTLCHCEVNLDYL